jgi:predicted regulator of Ras-like GTPase activity (Roadblock/LC7/MglB family)
VEAVALGAALTTIFSALKAGVPEIQALFLVHSDGSVVDQCAIPRPGFDADALTGEYLPLLQIARRASEDMGAGRVSEHILVTASSIVVASYLPSNHFSIVVTSNSAHLGRLRYEIKRFSADLERYLRGGESGADFRR